MEDALAGDILNANVLVYQGGKLDVKLRVIGPDAAVLFDRMLFSNVDDATGRLLPSIVKKGTTWGSPAGGTYTVCLDNRMAKFTAKALSFELTRTEAADGPRAGNPSAGPGGGAAAGGAAGVEATTESLRATVGRLLSRLTQVESAQVYAYHRGKRHRATLESNNERVAWWSVAESVASAAVAAAQVLLVRRWFCRPALLLPGGKL